MRVSEQMIRALDAASDRDIEDTGRALGYLPRRRTRPRRRIGRMLLIAAVLATLFGITAYAAGWFGLSSRLTETADTSASAEERDGVTHYLSFNDYAGTPAAQAHAEWQAFWWEYTEDRQFDSASELAWEQEIGEEQTAIAHIYGCGDQTMLDKLYAIRDLNEVRLHTLAVSHRDEKTFYELTGLEPFTDPETELQIQYVYEDGSFKGEGQVDLDGLSCAFTLVRGAKGALDSASNREERADSFEEWMITTDKGAELSIALGPVPRRDAELGQATHRNCYLFYDSPEYLVTIMGTVPNTEKAKEEAEALAQHFDFALICSGTTDLSQITEVKPRQAKPKQGLMTLPDWVETEEYKASSEFQRAFCAYADGLEENKMNVRGASFYYYYGTFPSQIPEVNDMSAEIEARYDLEMPRGVRAILPPGEVDPNRVTSSIGYRVPEGEDWSYGITERSQEERWATLGLEPFTENELISLFRYDNGAFCASVRFAHAYYDLHYVPKGAFYPLIRFVLHPEMEGWAYNSACGEQVYLVEGGAMEYPHTGFPYILYETDTAYVIVECLGGGDNAAYTLQSIADDIDFTQFP